MHGVRQRLLGCLRHAGHRAVAAADACSTARGSAEEVFAVHHVHHRGVCSWLQMHQPAGGLLRSWQQQHAWPAAASACRRYAKHKGKALKAAAAAATEDEQGAPAAEAQEESFALEDYERLMLAAVEHLRHELSGVRSGRANPGLLENIPVHHGGSTLPLKACGTVTVRSPQQLAVAVFDPQAVPAVARAIQNSPLQLAPSSEGSEVLVNLPRMTKEAVERMVKLVNLESEGALQSVRRARQKALDAVKKAFKTGGSTDDRKRLEKDVQRLHDKYVAEVDGLKKQKDTELREHKD